MLALWLLAACGETPRPTVPTPVVVAAEAPAPVPLSAWARPGLDGETVALADRADRRALVLIAQGNACPVFQQYAPTIRGVAVDYAERGVEVLLINASPQDTPATIAADLAAFGLALPVFVDRDQQMSRALGIVATSEALVIDPATWQVVFHGAIDDQISYDGRKDAPTKTYLRDALDDVLAGQPVRVPRTRSYGCAISYRSTP